MNDHREKLAALQNVSNAFFGNRCITVLFTSQQGVASTFVYLEFVAYARGGSYLLVNKNNCSFQS